MRSLGQKGNAWTSIEQRLYKHPPHVCLMPRWPCQNQWVSTGNPFQNPWMPKVFGRHLCQNPWVSQSSPCPSNIKGFPVRAHGFQTMFEIMPATIYGCRFVLKKPLPESMDFKVHSTHVIFNTMPVAPDSKHVILIILYNHCQGRFEIPLISSGIPGTPDLGI